MPERDELGALTVGQVDYVACAAASNPSYHCGADRFSFSTGHGLAFSLGEYASDPEGWHGGGDLLTNGEMRYDDRFDPYTSSEHHLYWTDATTLTTLTMVSMLPDASTVTAAASVPEAPAWTLVLADLAGCAWWRRRRPA